jgi:hypothetical protein
MKFSYKNAGPHIVAEDFGSEVVILNLENGKYFSANGNAASLWRDISNGCVPNNIIDFVKVPSIKIATKKFISKLISEGLIVRNTSKVSPDKNLFGFIATLEENSVPPVLEVFDDMAELILSDPVHDVSEDIGWPVRKEK